MPSENLNAYIVAQLKSWLRALGIKTSGNKTELIIRLQNVPDEIRGNFEDFAGDADATRDNSGDSSNNAQPNEINEETSSVEIVNETSTKTQSNEDAIEQTSVAAEEKESDKKECDSNEWLLLKYELELLKRECEIQKRENEIQKKEKELLNNGCERKSISNKKKLSDVKELISEFSGNGDCFKMWQTQLQNIRSVYNLADNNMRALIANRLKVNAFKWLHSRADLITMPFDKFLLEMSSLFEEKASKLMLKRKLEARRWLISESFEEYFHAKLILANRILIEEDELVEYLVEGIPKEALRSQAKMQRFRNKYEFLDEFRTIQ
ncbi:uncharacterized protein [Eurosta solidaginis]|uniref:uncharacterized protein n=1 Tax=Eurosta solidaginis TaxID=178769 RepID=UPI0035310B33